MPRDSGFNQLNPYGTFFFQGQMLLTTTNSNCPSGYDEDMSRGLRRYKTVSVTERTLSQDRTPVLK